MSVSAYSCQKCVSLELSINAIGFACGWLKHAIDRIKTESKDIAIVFCRLEDAFDS